MREVHQLLKRAMDLCLGACGLLATAPIMMAGAAAVRVTMGPPAFFRQKRPGLNGELFELIKVRTMRPQGCGTEDESDAQRLTSLGRWLRAWSIDELPTLVNVLRGDMSLVGPRPLLPRYLNRYTVKQARRHEVRPGVTGWAQVQGRNTLGWEEKLALDVWYVDNQSIVLDLRILLATASHVLKRKGIAHQGCATMEEFRGSNDFLLT